MTVAAVALLLTVPPPGLDPEVWRHLLGWEAVTRATACLVSEGGSKTVTTPKETKTYDATAWLLKPDRLRLRLDRRPEAGQKTDPTDYVTYICGPDSVFEYDGPARTVTEYPARFTDWSDTNPLLAVLSGRLTARQLVARFGVTRVKPDDPTYLYLKLTPHLPRDQAEFDELVLVLVRPGLPGAAGKQAYLPRTARIVKPHGSGVVTWDFPDIKADPTKSGGAPISPADFEPPLPPSLGWKMIPAR